MALGDLTLLLVGRDSLAEQLHVHLEHRGADLERAAAGEALDTIRVAVPDLVILSVDTSSAELDRIRDALASEAKPARVLVLCEKKKAAQTGTYKLDFVATLEPELGAELIASSIDSLCTLLAKHERSRPLRSLIADVRRSQLPAKPLAPIAAPPPAGTTKAAPVAGPKPKATLIGAPPAAIAAPIAIEPPKPIVEAPKPIVEAPKPIVEAPKPIVEAPKPIVAPVLSAPPKRIEAPKISAAPKPVVAPMLSAPPKPLAGPKTLQMPTVIAAPEPVDDISIFESVPPVESAPPRVLDDLDAATLPEVVIPQLFSAPAAIAAPAVIATPKPEVIAVPPVATTPVVVERAPSLAQRARVILSRTTRAQRAAAAAATMLCLIGVAIASTGDDEKEQLASEATASLNTVAKQVAQPAAPALISTAPAKLSAPPTPAPVPAPAPVSEAALDAPDDEFADGESYDPKVDPARARANFHVNAGHRLRKEGRLGMAEASYLKALDAMPNYARALSGLVAVHLARRDGVEALRWAKKLVALQPKRGVHHRLLGDAHALTGSTGAAKQAWHQGARLGDRVSRDRMR